MLAKKRRLAAAEVRHVLARGRSSRAMYISLKHLPGTTSLRAAVVVSKAVAKKAVVRNRLRRAVYRALMPITGVGEIVVFVQKIPPPPLTEAFAADLATLLKKST
jgi:ribonuclease P protein component